MAEMLDVRSDTVTRPTEGMRLAMKDAPVGDDVYGDDPSVNKLQSYVADLLGLEAALFMPTGTQSNLVAILTHCERGDEYITGADAHTYKYEGGGAAVLGSVQPQTLPFDDDGGLDLTEVASLIKDNDVHFARTRLLCLENTQHGRVQAVSRMQEAREFVDKVGLKLHLDGARMANAAVALDVPLKDIGSCFDSVSLCLSKGLGAPAGSLLVGSEHFIEQAKRWRKMTGGGMRQSGVLAAAGLLAMTEGLSRLRIDHQNAQRLAANLETVEGLTVREGWTQTNMVWLEFEHSVGLTLQSYARDRGVLLSARDNACRLVTHADVNEGDIDSLSAIISDFFCSDVYEKRVSLARTA